MTPGGGDTRDTQVKAIKSKKRSPGFEKKREETRDDTAELATKKGRQVFQEKIEG